MHDFSRKSREIEKLPKKGVKKNKGYEINLRGMKNFNEKIRGMKFLGKKIRGMKKKRFPGKNTPGGYPALKMSTP